MKVRTHMRLLTGRHLVRVYSGRCEDCGRPMYRHIHVGRHRRVVAAARSQQWVWGRCHRRSGIRRMKESDDE